MADSALTTDRKRQLLLRNHSFQHERAAELQTRRSKLRGSPGCHGRESVRMQRGLDCPLPRPASSKLWAEPPHIDANSLYEDSSKTAIVLAKQQESKEGAGWLLVYS